MNIFHPHRHIKWHPNDKCLHLLFLCDVCCSFAPSNSELKRFHLYFVLVPHTSLFTDRIYITGCTNVLSEHTNCCTEDKAIIMPDCLSHMAQQAWNSNRMTLPASRKIDIYPVTWKRTAFKRHSLCTCFSPAGFVLLLVS